MKPLLNAFLHLIFPPQCAHCRTSLSDSSLILCQQCLELLELIDPSDRCPYCFSQDYRPSHKICGNCQKCPPILNGLASAFDYFGPAASLVKKIKYQNQPHLAAGCGAYLAAQYLALEWPLPDVIVPVPIAFTHLIERGFNQSQLMAESLSKILQKPVKEVLMRKSGDYSQAGLRLSQRVKLDGSSILLKKNQCLSDQNILLIDDVLTTGSTMRRCAEALIASCPACIYGLTFCRVVTDE